MCVCLSRFYGFYSSLERIFTSPRNHVGVIFSLQFVCVCVCLSVNKIPSKQMHQFLSHKINFVTLCFRPFYQKKPKFFFEKPRNFQFFMCFGPRRSFYEKSSGVRRLASCGQNFNQEKFRFQIISKPFDRSTSYLV